MKVGGNESATKYFQSHGGSAALLSKDAKSKYTSNAATKYKDELKRRTAADAQEYVIALSWLTKKLTTVRYPDEVTITEILSPTLKDGSATPLGEPGDDFFSSWDKPSIKRPSNPPSRTQTPPVVSRTASPFLNVNTNGNGKPKTPVTDKESSSAPTASRAISSSAIRKTATAAAPRKANVLGAKKTQKLGAKKVVSSDLDFEAAEKKAKEEADKIEKLGYNPDAEEAVIETSVKSPVDKPKIASPTPISPPKAAFGATQGHQRGPSEVERLGMGMGRLGFGQVGGGKAAATAAAPKKMGFGSMGTSKAVTEGASTHSYYPTYP